MILPEFSAPGVASEELFSITKITKTFHKALVSLGLGQQKNCYGAVLLFVLRIRCIIISETNFPVNLKLQNRIN
jgi:hypothetical protein